MTRRQAREQAFIIIFEKSFQDDLTVEEIIDNAVEAGILEKENFSENLSKTVYENLEAVDKLIDENLVGWRKDRISKVSASILRLAIGEILYFTDIPNKVSVNEAVELAKTYAPTDDAAFINGVLSSVLKKIGA